MTIRIYEEEELESYRIALESEGCVPEMVDAILAGLAHGYLADSGKRDHRGYIVWKRTEKKLDREGRR